MAYNASLVRRGLLPPPGLLCASATVGENARSRMDALPVSLGVGGVVPDAYHYHETMSDAGVADALSDESEVAQAAAR